MALIRRSLAALLLLAAACNDEEPPVIAPGSGALRLSPASITAFPGDTVRIRVSDSRGRPLVPVVLGSTTAAATIDPTGLLTAVSPGTSVVTISVLNGGQTATASIPVTVLGLTIAPAGATMAVGGTVPFTAGFTGDSSLYGPLAWTSSDTTIATVGPDGRVRGVGPGIARIAVSAKGGRVRAEVVVTVQCGCPILESFTVTPTAVTLQTGATQQLTATVVLTKWAPEWVTRDVVFTSSDTTVAAVTSTGVITARRGGTAVVTATMKSVPSVQQLVEVTVRDRTVPGVSITGVTTGDPPVPVDLNAVRGRIRITVRIVDFTPRGVEILIGGRRALRLDSLPPLTGANPTLTFDVDTDARDAAGARLFPNGETRLEIWMDWVQLPGTLPQRVGVPLQLTLANP